jgi:alpha-L-arabinofuranosidase
VNAVLMQVPKGVSYLTPAGSVMRLFGRWNGKQGVAVKSAPSGLDIAASRTEGRVYLHVANTSYREGIDGEFSVEGKKVTGGRVLEIAPSSPRSAVSQDEPHIFQPREHRLEPGVPPKWRFAPGSVAVVELDTA